MKRSLPLRFLYRLLLRLSPPGSFAGMEGEMTDVFIKACGRALRDGGVPGFAGAVLSGLADAVRQAVMDWRRRFFPRRVAGSGLLRTVRSGSPPPHPPSKP